MRDLNKEELDALVGECREIAGAYGTSNTIMRAVVLHVLEAIQHPVICDDSTAKALKDWLASGFFFGDWISWNKDKELAISLAFPELYDAWDTANKQSARLREVEASLAASWKATKEKANET